MICGRTLQLDVAAISTLLFPLGTFPNGDLSCYAYFGQRAERAMVLSSGAVHYVSQAIYFVFYFLVLRNNHVGLA